MAEITKVTTPMIPRENLGAKNRPLTEQTFELNNPNKVNKSVQDNGGKIMDRDATLVRDNLGRAAVQPLLRDVGELMYNIHKMVALLQMGISTSEVLQTPEMKELLQKIFASPEELLAVLQEQDEAATIFKGESFSVLRDILARFDNNPRVQDAIVQLLKTFEYNVNTNNSVKSIIYNCENLLDYMFSRDRDQFAGYLDGLTEMLMPELLPQTEETLQQQLQNAVPLLDADGNPVLDEKGEPILQKQAPPVLEGKEAAQVLKNNLLPLLGEIVVKYHQNGRIRDQVMVVVHNIVRVDKGTPEALREATANLVYELKKVANLPESFERNLLQSLRESVHQARGARNEVMETMARIISETLHDPESKTPAALRQAENLLISLLQNQSSMMDVLHFVLPMQVGEDFLYAELYVDPESDEGKKRQGSEQARKLFLSVESEEHGNLELSFLQIGERVDFSMWCPEKLVDTMSGLKRSVAGIMQVYGYTMTGYSVEKLERAHTIAEVFPKLLNRKVGIDVRV